MQCFVGDEARRRRRIEERGGVASSRAGTTRRSSRRSSTTPTSSRAPALGPKTYSFVGRDGSLLALRPDFTSLLAKIAAGRLRDRPAPLRLYYSGEVLRYEPPKAGRQSELYQMGLEHLGGGSRRRRRRGAGDRGRVPGSPRGRGLGAGPRPRGCLRWPARGGRARAGRARDAAGAGGGQGPRGRPRGSWSASAWPRRLREALVRLTDVLGPDRGPRRSRARLRLLRSRRGPRWTS